MNPNGPKDPNQGEGNRTAARSYEAKLKEFIAQGKVDPAARDAAQAVDGPEAAELRAAEEAGKAPARTTMVAAVVGVGRALVESAKAAIHHARTERAAKRANKQHE